MSAAVGGGPVLSGGRLVLGATQYSTPLTTRSDLGEEELHVGGGEARERIIRAPAFHGGLGFSLHGVYL